MRWITAQNLERWADSEIAKLEFPGLVGSLIRATAPEISDFRFPSGDKGKTRGFDGHLIASLDSEFVPNGESIWEFGAGEDVFSSKKYEKDYKKRTGDFEEGVRKKDISFLLPPELGTIRLKRCRIFKLGSMRKMP
jgi:hypothetical protein